MKLIDKSPIFAGGYSSFTFLNNRNWMASFGVRIMEWYKENGRDLPWRNTKDPYRIWVSEIILQQTRVAQGYDYYCRFIRRFPDVNSLAEAGEDEVMKYWQGLGYYSRARNLHAAAREIAGKGYFPDTYEEVRRLKGVGDYTAAAICSFAFGLPCAVVDGNVYRVLSRWMGIDMPVDSVKGKNYFRELAEELLVKEDPALYNQAIMDFGALQCTPSSPSCMFCPLSDSCVALQKGWVDRLPVKQHKTKVSERFFTYLFIISGDFTFIHKRTGDDIWKNLYEMPLMETAALPEEENLSGSEEWKRLFEGCTVLRTGLVEKNVKHVLSHRVIHASCYEVEIREGDMICGPYRKVLTADLHKFPVSRLVSRFFSLILKPNK